MGVAHRAAEMVGGSTDNHLFKAALDASVDGHSLWAPILDDDGRVVNLVCFYTNAVGAAITGNTVGEITGSRLLNPSRLAGNAEFAEALLNVVQSGQPIRHRTRLFKQTGEEVWIDYVAVSLAGGLSISGRDVTAEVTLHAELERANAELAKLAATDPLTDLPNRRAWSLSLTKLLEQATTDGAPLVVALLDLDRFKLFNDTHGHLAGDEHLRKVAARWREALPVEAMVARMGGEEFAVALPNLDPTSARELLVKLCALVPHGETSSAGMTVWDGSEDESSLLGRADAALYAAKHAGRNRVEALLPLR